MKLPGEEVASEVIKDLAKPVYDDALHPAATEIGSAAQGLLRFVALPFKFLGMTAEQLELRYARFIQNAVNKVPEEKRVMPKPEIICPLLEHVKFVFEDNEDLLGMFEELLASSMNEDSKDEVHPAYVDALKKMSGEDAKILLTLLKGFIPRELDSIRSATKAQRGIYGTLFAGIAIRAGEDDEYAFRMAGVDDKSAFCILEGEKNPFSNNPLTILKTIGIAEERDLHSKVDMLRYSYLLAHYHNKIGMPYSDTPAYRLTNPITPGLKLYLDKVLDRYVSALESKKLEELGLPEWDGLNLLTNEDLNIPFIPFEWDGINQHFLKSHLLSSYVNIRTEIGIMHRSEVFLTPFGHSFCRQIHADFRIWN